MAKILLEKATKLYKWEKKWHEAVSELDVTVEQGEFVFVVGSSGAGKSTMLKLMSGELHPNRGAAYLDKLNLARVPPWFLPKVRMHFGRVSQESQLMRRRTIQENLAIVARVGHGSVEAKVSKALGIVGMPRAADKYPGELSIGECRRVELARALVNSPSILILDELIANLDEDNIWDILQLLMELNRMGTTVIMATHASSAVNILRKRVITLVDGRIVADVKRGKYGDISSPNLLGSRPL